MARRYNELFIGSKYLNIEGRSIKHPSLIKLYASVNLNKIHDKPIDLIGIDLETNYKTAELKLLGFYDNEYSYYTSNFLETLFSYIKYAKRENKVLAYWNRLDPFVLFKQFLYLMDEDAIQLALERYGHISGEWNKKDSKWEVQPVTKVKIGNYEFGIKNVIRSSIQFYYYHYEDKDLKTIWAYDIATLYHYGLEKEATSRLDYYSKVDKSAHLVEWDKFESDKNYRDNIVLKSNMLDAKAVKDLGMIIQNEFKIAFGHYPKTLISQGSLARAAVVAKIINKYKLKYGDNEALVKKHSLDDIKSIGFINFYDNWLESYGEDVLKDLYAMSMEAYSGGYIEAIRYGFTKEAYYADLASAYPSIEIGLYDLRNSKIIHGNSEPPHVDYSYCFIRGVVNIPEHINFHSITIKHPIYKETNIRAVGEYRASYTLDERDYLISLGASFSDESWVNIETTGNISPLAEVIKEFIDLRNTLLAEGNSAEFMAKIAANSAYGILFEATDTYEEYIDVVDDKEVLKTIKGGYRGGEFFNPIFATYITAKTRIKLARAANEIESKGGKVILLMTDSVFWTGEANMIPSDMVRDKKTLGYFETPEKIYNMICLGSGRYGFETSKGYYQAKKRGLNATAIHSPEGVLIEDFSWYNAVKAVENVKDNTLNINVRSLISVGLVVNSLNYSFHDLGKVIEQKREVDLIVGKTKRVYEGDISDPKKLLTGLLDTKSIYLGYGMLGVSDYVDQTLPKLRNLMFLKTCKSTKDNKRKAYRKGSKKYYNTNEKSIKSTRKNKYNLLRESGFTSYESKKMLSWDIDKINVYINGNLNKKNNGGIK
jgi:hypothetical protein